MVDPTEAARRAIAWDMAGRLVDDESAIQNNAPLVARAFLRAKEALEAINRRLSDSNLTFDELIRETTVAASLARAGLDDLKVSPRMKAEGPDEVGEQVRSEAEPVP